MKLRQQSKAAFLSKCYKRSLEETDAEYEITPWFTHLCSLTDGSSTGPVPVMVQHLLTLITLSSSVIACMHKKPTDFTYSAGKITSDDFVLTD